MEETQDLRLRNTNCGFLWLIKWPCAWLQITLATNEKKNNNNSSDDKVIVKPALGVLGYTFYVVLQSHKDVFTGQADFPLPFINQ